MVESIPKIIPFLSKNKVNNEIVGISISMILDRQREDIAQLGLGLLKNLAKSIGPDLIERYFYREILEIVAEKSQNLAKAVIEVIGEIFQCPKGESLKSKFLPIFIQYCDDENWNIRKQCVNVFPIIFKKATKELENTLIPHYLKFLKDKSKWVKELAVNNCAVLIVYLQVFIPDQLIKSYYSVSESGYYSAAYYFSAILLTLGTTAWGDMKKLLHKILESDCKNKICIIHSIHEIAKILGAETSAKELIEIFDKFLEDSDLVLEAYTSLPNFLREIYPEARDKYKKLIKQMGKDMKNWRTRYILANNICEYIGVFDYNSIYAEIWPLSLELCEDLHFTVRKAAASEVSKLAMYLLAKNSDWKRHIEMCIRKYSRGSINNKITFLNIMKHIAESEIASDFNAEILNLAKDHVKNVRIMCAETVIKSKNNVWAEALEILEADNDPDVMIKVGKKCGIEEKSDFIVPPMIRNDLVQEIGGIVKFNHTLQPKFGKINNYEILTKAT